MRMRRVDEYMSQATGYEMSWLQLLMINAAGGFFGNIWIPTRQYDPNTGQMSENYTYYNVGMPPDELADLYWTEYSGNYLIGGGSNIDTDYTYLSTRCRAIFKKNLGKYKKLVELEGLIWNPLWNVDGTEIHQLLEKHGAESYLESGSGSSATGRNLKDSRSVTAYDSNTPKPEYEETHVGQDTSTPSASATYNSDTISSSGGQVSHADTISSEAKASKSLRSHDAFKYAVKVEDTAFGTAISDADVLHTEKTVRQGNIGVTKTTELVEDARKVVTYSIIQEFFNDINEVILVGIYGDYMSQCEKFYHHFVESSAEIDHIEVDKYGHIVKVAMKGDSTQITPNQIIFGNRISGQS